MKYILTAAIFMASIAYTSCSSDSAESASDTGKPHISPADSSAYNLGRSHAQRLMEQCRTTESVRDELLDIRARETNIRCRAGENAADAYIYGFRSYLTEAGDTLATTIF